MKIIKNNVNRIKENDDNLDLIKFECTCPNCKSILEIDKNDILHDDIYDIYYIICPCCKEQITDKYFDKVLTLESIEYPFDFYKISSSSEETVHLSDKEINRYIKECIEFFKYNPNEPYKYIGTGDSLIIVFNHDDEYWFVVAKNYEESFVNKT